MLPEAMADGSAGYLSFAVSTGFCRMQRPMARRLVF